MGGSHVTTLNSSANSNTSSNKSQPRQEDVEFLKLLKHVSNTGAMPDLHGNIGRYKQYVGSLVESLEQDGMEGFNAAKITILNKETRLALLDAIQSDQEQPAEQQPEDKRFTTNGNGKQVIKFASIEDIFALPDPDELIDGIIETVGSSLLYGVSGTGKTFMALHTALSIAHGIPWFGRKVKQGIVWYINTEGQRGLKKRLQAWYKEHPDLTPSPNFKVIPWSLDLRENMQDLINTLEDQEQKPVLIVVDNFSMCASEVNQNAQNEVAHVLRIVNNLAQEYETHIMLIHHTNKEGDVNGTMAFRNHVDVMVELRKEDKFDRNSPILFTSQKTREDDPFEDIRTQLKQVDLHINSDTLKVVTSCVVVPSSEPTAADRTADTQAQERQTMLAILTEHGRLSVNRWIAECKAVGISKCAYYHHIASLRGERAVTYTQPAKRGLAGYYEPVLPSPEQESSVTVPTIPTIPTIPENS